MSPIVQSSPAVIKVEPKLEPPDESCCDDHQSRQDDPFPLPAGISAEDIHSLADKELAKRIYQAETGIKSEKYFVLIPKADQARYLARAKQLKAACCTARGTQQQKTVAEIWQCSNSSATTNANLQESLKCTKIEPSTGEECGQSSSTSMTKTNTHQKQHFEVVKREIMEPFEFKEEQLHEKHQQEEPGLPPGITLDDIFTLSDKELAKRLYQSDTGIKYLYYVLISKTAQLRYLVCAKQLKHRFFGMQMAKAKKSQQMGRGRPARRTLDNLDVARADIRALHSALMSEQQRARKLSRRQIWYRALRARMTPEELEAERAKTRERTRKCRARARMLRNRMADDSDKCVGATLGNIRHRIKMDPIGGGDGSSTSSTSQSQQSSAAAEPVVTLTSNTLANAAEEEVCCSSTQAVAGSAVPAAEAFSSPSPAAESGARDGADACDNADEDEDDDLLLAQFLARQRPLTTTTEARGTH